MKIIECRNSYASGFSSFFFFFVMCKFSLLFNIFHLYTQQYIKLVIPIVLLTQEKIKDDYFANVKDKLRQFDTFLGDKPWFAGDGVSLYIAILFWFKKSRDIADSLNIVAYYKSQF